MKSRIKNTLLNTGTGIFYLVIHTLFSFVFTNIVISQFGSSDNGMIASIKQVLTYTSLVEGGLGVACVMSYYSPLSNNDIPRIKNIYKYSKKLFVFIGLFYFTLLSIVSVIYPFIAKASYDWWYVSLLCFVVGANKGISYIFFEKDKSLITADQNNKVEQICLIATDILSLVLVLIAVNVSAIKSVLFIEILICSLTILQLVYYRVVMRKLYPFLHDKKIITDDSEKPIKQVNSSIVHTLCNTISYNTDIILLTIFQSLVIVSIYSVYALVFSMATSIFAAVTRGIEGSFGNLYNSDSDEFKKVFKKFEYFYILLSALIIGGIALIIKPFIVLYTSSEVTVSYWDSSYFILFALIAFFNSIRNPHAMLIRVSENLSKTKWIFIIEAIVNLSISLALVKPLGINGVLIGTVASVVIRNAYVIFFVYKNVLKISPFEFFAKMFINIVPLVACFFIARIPFFENADSYLRLILLFVIDAALAVLLILIVNIVINTKGFLDLMGYFKSIILRLFKGKHSLDKGKK